MPRRLQNAATGASGGGGGDKQSAKKDEKVARKASDTMTTSRLDRFERATALEPHGDAEKVGPLDVTDGGSEFLQDWMKVLKKMAKMTTKPVYGSNDALHTYSDDAELRTMMAHKILDDNPTSKMIMLLFSTVLDVQAQLADLKTMMKDLKAATGGGAGAHAGAAVGAGGPQAFPITDLMSHNGMAHNERAMIQRALKVVTTKNPIALPMAMAAFKSDKVATDLNDFILASGQFHPRATLKTRKEALSTLAKVRKRAGPRVRTQAHERGAGRANMRERRPILGPRIARRLGR